ncbi:universal stress protein [Kocuria sp. M1R5S2]|uniref:universal stress protein n=1 Tax=Kocuria rhizosphaerae TaxID=3376285 RepID=UPI0037A5B4BD
MSGTEGRIVVGVDGSDESKEALRHGARLSGALGAPLEAVMCWEDTILYDGYGVADPEELRRGSEALLERTVSEAFDDGTPEGLGSRLVRGRPANGLIEVSEDALLLVVGRRRGSGVVGKALGSVSSALVAHARCPVLVVRH